MTVLPSAPPRPGPLIRRVAVFGAADGLGIALGLIAGMTVSHQSAHAIWIAALSGGIAELFSMANGQRISDSHSGWFPPLAIGLASLAACTAPAVPYSFSSGPLALTAALLLCALAAAAISWARPEHGRAVVIETFGLLIITGTACALAGLWL